MSEEPKADGLVKRVTQLAATLPGTPMELVERIRAIREQAHVLSPAVTAASIPSHIKINTVVDVIDTTFDPKTGRGQDVYFQASIHKSEKRGDTFIPLEVSLNATCIKRLMAGAGVSVTHSDEIRTGEQNHWKWQSRGKMRDFDGSWRELPPGTAEIDLRDGSAQIGEWTSEEWKKREAAAEQRAKERNLPEKERWKEKPKPIAGWTGERVIGARRFGLRLAEAKSLNALGRNFGLKQVYSLEELKKPFVIFRATFNPDMSDPDIKKMVTASELGATNLLFGPSTPLAALPSRHEAAEAHADVVDGHVEAAETTPASADVPFEPAKPATPVYHVTGVFRTSSGGYHITTKETGAEKLLTPDEKVATTAHGAKSVDVPVLLHLEQTAEGRRIITLTLVEEGGY